MKSAEHIALGPSVVRVPPEGRDRHPEGRDYAGAADPSCKTRTIAPCAKQCCFLLASETTNTHTHTHTCAFQARAHRCPLLVLADWDILTPPRSRIKEHVRPKRPERGGVPCEWLALNFTPLFERKAQPLEPATTAQRLQSASTRPLAPLASQAPAVIFRRQPGHVQAPVARFLCPTSQLARGTTGGGALLCLETCSDLLNSAAVSWRMLAYSQARNYAPQISCHLSQARAIQKERSLMRVVWVPFTILHPL